MLALGLLALAIAQPWVLPAHLLVIAVLLSSLLVTGQGSQGLSMVPTLKPWTRGLLIGHPPFPVRRDHVVLAMPDGMRPVCKRVAGMPGDRLRFADGGVFRAEAGGWRSLPLPLDVMQLDPQESQEVVVPDGHVYLLGDHVTSIDSRRFGPVPLSAVLGRYVPLLQRGAPDPVGLTEVDRAEIRELGELRPPALTRLQQVISAGGAGPDVVTLLLWRAWREAGRPERATDALERAWNAELHPESRGFWSHLLARELEPDPERCLAVVRRQLDRDPDTAFTTALRQWEATMLARSGRWSEALAAAERAGADQFVAVRISALLGLGRGDEAEALVAATEARAGWAHGSHGPYYRGLVLAAHGRDEEAVEALLAAIDLGFTDPELFRSTPHLARLREGPGWRRVAAALHEHGPGASPVG